MDAVKIAFLVLHFIGLASLFGGFLTQMKFPIKSINAAMVHGVLTQLVTGIALAGITSMGDGDVNHVKIGVKLLITVAVAVLVFAYKKKDSIPVPLWGAIGGLTVVNIIIAVAWR